ncbi:MAG: hypothetical protein LBB64_02260 [Dysgonamonadaceae bacterium]|jgi:hypothetical protein|nr:hypothetical protein [Dysgonamonadaceae bacterium]
MPTEEKHPWNWYVPSGATTLTLPVGVARVGATVSFDTLTELYRQEINTNQHIY